MKRFFAFCCGVLLTTASSYAASVFTDWTSADASADTGLGTLGTISVSLTTDNAAYGGVVSAVLDGTLTVFSEAAFDPQIAATDGIGLKSASSFTVRFSQPVSNPTLHIYALADSTLTFSDGNAPISFRLLKSNGSFDVLDGGTSTTIRGVSTATDSSGSLQFLGTFTQISWTSANANPGDGFDLQISIEDDRLMAHCPLEGNALDLSGNNLSGTVSNASFVLGLAGLALRTTGSLDSFAGIPPNVLLAPSNEVTVSLWFKVTTFAVNQYACLLYKAGAPPSGDFRDRSFTFWILPGGGIHFTSTGQDAPAQTILNSATGLFGLNEWVHMVGIVDAPNHQMTLYVNGSVAGTGAYPSGAILSGDYPLRIGAPFLTLGDQTGFDGAIDDVRIYARALSSGEVINLFMARASDVPSIITHALSQSVVSGSTVGLTVSAAGALPLNYQWRRKGVNIPSAISPTLTLNSVTAADSDCYSVVVWNSFGSVESQPACLAVLAEGGNGNAQQQEPALVCPLPEPGADNLVLVTHGVQLFWRVGQQRADDISWITNMADGIRARLPQPANWEVRPLPWTGRSQWTEPNLVSWLAKRLGHSYGRDLATQNWAHVHLIAHSAGSALIEAIASELRSSPNPPEIHETFLDPFSGWVGRNQHRFGQNADWADNYFANDTIAGVQETVTDRALSQAYNVDVTWWDPNKEKIPTSGSDQLTGSPSCTALSDHGWPIRFYLSNILEVLPACPFPYGFSLSKEAGGWSNHDDLHSGDSAPALCRDCPRLPSTDRPLHRYGQVNLNLAAYDISSDGATITDYSAFDLSSVRIFPAPDQKSASNTNAPAWLAVAVEVTNWINFIEFEAAFSQPRVAQGLLTVFWNTNRIGFADERVASPGFETFRFTLPQTVTNGLYTLSFRLDSFTNTTSSITVTNVTTGFDGVKQPFTLAVVGSTNRAPTLKLTGATGFNYLLQSSTNLVDWTPSALLLNTNGTVLFTDFSATNSAQRFYRALLP